MSSKIVFDLGQWFGQMFLSTVQFNDLYTFVRSKKAFEEYLKEEIEITTASETEGLKTRNFDLELDKVYVESSFKNVNKSLKLLKNMIIVYQVSILEAVIDECFKLIFLVNPNKMKFLNKENGLTHTITLDSIINASTKYGILKTLAGECSNICTTGNSKKVLNRLNKLTGNILNRDILRKIGNIIERRNEVVHELKDLKISPKDLLKINDDMTSFLIDISRHLYNIGIEVIDPINLLKQEVK